MTPMPQFLPGVHDAIPPGSFLVPLCTDAEGVADIVRALDSCARNSVGHIHFMNALQYVGNPQDYECVESWLEMLEIPVSGIRAMGSSTYRLTNQAIPNATFTPIDFTTEESASAAGIHDTGVNPSQFAANIEGWWEFSATVTFAASTVGTRILQIAKNGVNALAYTDQLPCNPGEITAMQISKKVHLLPGDFVQVMAWQNSGFDLDVVGQYATLSGQFFFFGK